MGQDDPARMGMMPTVYRIAEWSKFYENNRTKELKHMTWVPEPNQMDGDGYTELLDHASGAAHYGAWEAILKIASRCDPRGTLVRAGGKPHDPASLCRISRIPQAVFDDAMPRLVSIGWLVSEVVASSTDTSIPQDDAGLPQDGAGKSQDKAALQERNGTERNGSGIAAMRDGDDAGTSDPANRLAVAAGIEMNVGHTQRAKLRDLIAIDGFEAARIALTEAVAKGIGPPACINYAATKVSGEKAKKSLAMAPLAPAKDWG